MLICRQIANELQIVVSRFEFRIKKNWSKWSFNFNNWKIPPVFYLYLPLLTRLKEASSCTSRHCVHENDQLTCYGGYFHFQRSVSWRTKLNRVDNITRDLLSTCFGRGLTHDWVKKPELCNKPKLSLLYFIVDSQEGGIYCWALESLFLLSITWTCLTVTCKKPPGWSQTALVKYPYLFKGRVLTCKWQV